METRAHRVPCHCLQASRLTNGRSSVQSGLPSPTERGSRQFCDVSTIERVKAGPFDFDARSIAWLRGFVRRFVSFASLDGHNIRCISAVPGASTFTYYIREEVVVLHVRRATGGSCAGMIGVSKNLLGRDHVSYGKTDRTSASSRTGIVNRVERARPLPSRTYRGLERPPRSHMRSPPSRDGKFAVILVYRPQYS